jgi:VWFA-related protein
MKKYPGFMTCLCTWLVICLAVGVLSPSIVAQKTTDKAPPFGSSLKRPKAEINKEGNAQTGPKNNEAGLSRSEDTIRVDTSLVVVDVSVKDGGGSRYITGLTKGDFVVTEDNQPQVVDTLTLGDDAARLPRSIVLIFDRSDSELPYLEASIEAAKTLVKQLTPSDEMAIVTDDIELAIGFTNDRKKLKQTLDSLKKLTLTGYHTRSMQFSALLATLRELIDPSKKRPIIVFQTDGDEVARLSLPGYQRPSSEYDMNTVYAEVEKSQVSIYTVIPNDRLIDIPQEEVPKRVNLIWEKARLARSRYKDMWYGYERLPPKAENNSTRVPLSEDQLQKMRDQLQKMREKFFERACELLVMGQTAAAHVAELTGGWTSFLEKPEQANEIYGRILSDINHRYVLSYYSTNNQPDKKLRRVQIKVRGHPDYIVQGRTSYYAKPR